MGKLTVREVVKTSKTSLLPDQMQSGMITAQKAPKYIRLRCFRTGFAEGLTTVLNPIPIGFNTYDNKKPPKKQKQKPAIRPVFVIFLF